MYNESRKKQSHIYIMAQTYWEKKQYYGDIYPAFDDQKNKINKSKIFMQRFFCVHFKAYCV